jgi:hypothetical protein
MAMMIAEYEDEYICDMAQYYHVYDYQSLPIETVITLSAGLPLESRVMRKMSKQNATTTELLLAMICDDLNAYLWSMTKDAKHGKNRPKSLVEELSGLDNKKEKNKGFASSNAYEEARARILGRANNNG